MREVAGAAVEVEAGVAVVDAGAELQEVGGEAAVAVDCRAAVAALAHLADQVFQHPFNHCDAACAVPEAEVGGVLSACDGKAAGDECLCERAVEAGGVGGCEGVEFSRDVHIDGLVGEVASGGVGEGESE